MCQFSADLYRSYVYFWELFWLQLNLCVLEFNYTLVFCYLVAGVSMI